MASTREAILTQLTALMNTIPGLAIVARDRGELGNDQRPGIIILDGAETIIGDPASLKTVRMPPAIFAFRPQIIFVAKERDTPANLTTNGQPNPIGPELSVWLEQIQTTIFNDGGLLDLVTTNGQITYLGHDTDMQWGSSMIGAIQTHWQFNYPFFPQYAPPRTTSWALREDGGKALREDGGTELRE